MYPTLHPLYGTHTRYITCERTGVRKSISLWAKELGTRENTIRQRIDRCGWSTQKAITTPVQSYRGVRQCAI